MKHLSSYFLSIGLLLTAGHDAMAQQISRDDAADIARSWYAGRNGHSVKRSAGSNDGIRLAHAVRSSEDDAENVYVFNAPESGFVIVAGDDRVETPILGFCDAGEFDADMMPDGLKWLIGEYSHQIDVIRKNMDGTDRKRKPKTEKDPNGYHMEFQDVTDINDGGPLIKTFWVQDQPYNWVIKEKIGGIYADKTVPATGCAATALAQILNYWQWPKKGTGSHTYTDYNGLHSDPTNGTEITSNFAEHEYKWQHMRIEYEGTYDDDASADYGADGKYNTDEGNAVAQLMYDCGVSINMRYGSNKTGSTGSGGREYDVVNALIDYFGYASTVTARVRGNKGKSDVPADPNYTDGEWEAMLKAEIDAKRPIYYVGQNEAGTESHAYVVDGYGYGHGTDYYGEPNVGVLYFHINWGWGKTKYPQTYNGYFRSTVFKYHSASKDSSGEYPLHDYNYKQYAIVGIQPDRGDYWNDWSDYGTGTYKHNYAYSNDELKTENEVPVKGRLSRDGKYREVEIKGWGRNTRFAPTDGTGVDARFVIDNTTNEVITHSFFSGRENSDGTNEYWVANPENSIFYNTESYQKATLGNQFHSTYDPETKKLTLNLAYSGLGKKPDDKNALYGVYTDYLELPSQTYDLTVSNANIATLFLDYNATIPEGVKAYYVTDKGGKQVKFNKMSDVIPQNAGVVIQAKAGTYTFAENTTAKPSGLDGNLLRGTIGEYTFADNPANVYFLTVKDSKPSFVRATGGTIAGHKAWLEYSGTTALDEIVTIDFATGILDVDNDGGGGSAVRYNLAGQQVDENYRGIVISGGKKYLKK